MVQLSHSYMTTGKTIAFTVRNLVGKLITLFYNTLSRFVIAFLPRNFNFLAAVTICSDFVAQENKMCLFSPFPPFICHEVIGPDAMILVLWMLKFKLAFSLFSFTFIKRLFSSFSLSAVREGSSACLRWLVFLLAILI